MRGFTALNWFEGGRVRWFDFWLGKVAGGLMGVSTLKQLTHTKIRLFLQYFIFVWVHKNTHFYLSYTIE